MSAPSSEPRAVRPLRITLLTTAGAAVAYGVLGVALTVMSGETNPWPGVSLLLVAQAVALAGAVGAGLAWRRALQSLETPEHLPGIAAGVRGLLSLLLRIHGALLILGVTVWMIARPDAWLAILACAAVAAQLLAVLRFLRGPAASASYT
ncbi:hypothetical protein [Bogoriella caseilytica]|uniref:Uncharacterized protein n=1 Tax=Bogoriella caseilytica TaxID=56055 RepID=A0A3N2BAZ3_9MICO|nr:hypothetical protein [Bogoriella caseilytica]ROR72426.1 hypothetical protein EDD31_0777 [Bogoriella caseilytica]